MCLACADPGIFVRGGDPGSTGRENLAQRSLVHKLFYSFTEGILWFILKKLFFHGFRGGPTFSRGGVQLFPVGDPNDNFYRNLEIFQGRGSGPQFPLWMRACLVLFKDRT